MFIHFLYNFAHYQNDKYILSIIYNIKKQIAEIVLTRKLLSEKIPSGKAVNVSTDQIVFFFNCASTKDLNLIIDFLKKSNIANKTTSVLAYCDFDIEENKIEDSNIYIVSQTDFNVFGGIKGRLLDWLSNNKFDILISFAVGYDLFCNKIISGLLAEFKAGNFHEQNVHLFDLTIKHKTSRYSEQYKLFNFYLNNLKINI